MSQPSPSLTPNSGDRTPITAADLRGVLVPLVTPFTKAGQIDQGSLLELIRWLLAEGVHGLVLAGTTGESPTVTWSEVEILLPAVEACVGGRVPLLVGTGTNDTAESVMRTRRARDLGADGAFVVCPYYSRPAAAGVIAHYQAVAAVGLPVVAYHIPYRTGLTLDRPALRAILAIPGVIGLKESSGGLDNVAALSDATASILCGEDALFLPALTVGARGGIVASANLLPRTFVDVYEAAVAGDLTRAQALFARARALIELLFAEPSPAPLKWALARRHRIDCPVTRLPMVPISAALAARLEAALGLE